MEGRVVEGQFLPTRLGVPDPASQPAPRLASSPPAIQIEGLVKRLRHGVTAIDHLDLVVPEGQIMGLAGPNGSGKSVTLRVLLGLVRPSAGRALIFGEPVRPGARVLGRVGALVDGPGFVPHLSGLENLRLAWRLTGRARADLDIDIDDALMMAGLGRAIDRPYGTYSHGMRYRLGLAQALLGQPDLLLLDEPATGLDPSRIFEVREVIAMAARRGTTVLVSSHHLAEVEQTCTHACVMQQGRLVASGPIADLVGSVGTLSLQVSDPARARRALLSLTGVHRTTVSESGLVLEGDELRPMTVFAALDDAGIAVKSFRRGRTLEEAYLDLCHAGNRGVRPPRPAPR